MPSRANRSRVAMIISISEFQVRAQSPGLGALFFGGDKSSTILFFEALEWGPPCRLLDLKKKFKVFFLSSWFVGSVLSSLGQFCPTLLLVKIGSLSLEKKNLLYKYFLSFFNFSLSQTCIGKTRVRYFLQLCFRPGSHVLRSLPCVLSYGRPDSY